MVGSMVVRSQAWCWKKKKKGPEFYNQIGKQQEEVETGPDLSTWNLKAYL